MNLPHAVTAHANCLTRALVESPAAVAGLKFNECLPLQLAMRTLAGRLADPSGIAHVLGGRVIQVRGTDAS